MIPLGHVIFDVLNAEQWVGNRQPVIYGEGGMSSTEIAQVENALGFRLPQDFTFLLQNIQDPDGVFFPWARFSISDYNESIDWVFHGISFDIEHNAFWLSDRWGPKPEKLSSRLEIAKADFPTWPKLLPVCGHRFLPATPCAPDNPVFSVMQTDIIYYGANLGHYLMQEFIREQDHKTNTSAQDIRKIDVWSSIVEGAGNLTYDPSVPPLKD